MKKLSFTCFIILLMFSLTVDASTSTLSTNNSHTPERIISLKPNITELLFEIGAGDQVVGVTTWCDKPEAAKKLPKIADYIKPNIEMIMALKPDLVVTSTENSIKAPIDILERMGIPVLLLPFQSIDDLLASTKKTGEVTGHIDEAKELIRRFAAIRKERTTRDEGRGTLIIVGKRPLIAAGPKTFLNEVVRLAGGRNIVEGKIPYPHVNMELVLAKNPDVIIDLSMGSEKSSSVQHPSSINTYWGRYPIQAVTDGRVYALDISDFRIGPGLIEQVATLKKILGENDN